MSVRNKTRLGWRSAAAITSLVLLSALAAVSATPAGAAIIGIQGTVTAAGGAGVNGVKVDLFRANADGSRGTFLSEIRTDAAGNYQFRPGDGCYVVTVVAPAGATFNATGTAWYQRSMCLSAGAATDWISPRLNGTGGTGGGSAAAPAPAPAPACAAGKPIWNLVFDDQFSGDGAALGSSWSAYNSTGNAGNGLRRPSALSQWGGTLNLRASMEGGTIVSGGLSHKLSQKYGRYEFRVRTDKDLSQATSGVVLTWPSSGVHPRDGENNIYETLGTPGDRHEFYSFIHKPFGTVHDQDYTVHPVDASQWHTMVMEWAPDSLVLYRDGVAVKTINETSADLIPDNPHFMAIQLDAWKSSVPSPVWMQLDYVKIWSYGGKTAC
ncbi:MAG: family 16 glycosylhydrolase [Acidimicrobiales bacterium]